MRSERHRGGLQSVTAGIDPSEADDRMVQHADWDQSHVCCPVGNGGSAGSYGTHQTPVTVLQNVDSDCL